MTEDMQFLNDCLDSLERAIGAEAFDEYQDLMIEKMDEKIEEAYLAGRRSKNQELVNFEKQLDDGRLVLITAEEFTLFEAMKAMSKLDLTV